MRIPPVLIALAPLALLQPALGQESDRLDDLEQRLEAQETELERLREELAGRPAPPGETGPEADEERPWTERFRVGAFFIEDTDKRWRLDLHARLQIDAVALLDGNDRDFDDSLAVRRARVEFRGNLYDRVSFDLGIEVGRGGSGLRNGYLTLRLHRGLNLRAGQMLLPFSDERRTSSKYLIHPERSVLVARIVGSREIGAQVHGSLLDRLLYYSLGIYGGDGQNIRLNSDDDVDVAGRLEVRPLTDDTLILAINGIYTPTNRDQRGPLTLRTAGNTVTRFLTYDLANRRLGRRWRGGLGARAVRWGGELKGEVNFDYQEEVLSPAFALEDLLTWSWFVSASWAFLGELDPRHDGTVVVPEHPLWDPVEETSGIGAFQLAARYEELASDDQARDRGFAVGTDRMRAVTLSGHWYPWEEVRLTVSYTYSHFEQGVFDSQGSRHVDDHVLIVRWAAYF
jgi:phosphate-selective porin OprO and OprP